jgi:hypothetical protein
LQFPKQLVSLLWTHKDGALVGPSIGCVLTGQAPPLARPVSVAYRIANSS